MRVYCALLAFVLSLGTCTGLYGQQVSEASGIIFTYKVEGEYLDCSLKAPTTGWIGVGFNQKNTIVGSDLLLFNVVQGKVSCTDLFIQGIGNPVEDALNGGGNTISLLDGREEGSTTQVHFSIPLNSGDVNDFVHKIGQEAWLILAYSVADDFSHHSRVRKHIPFVIDPD